MEPLPIENIEFEKPVLLNDEENKNKIEEKNENQIILDEENKEEEKEEREDDDLKLELKEEEQIEIKNENDLDKIKPTCDRIEISDLKSGKIMEKLNNTKFEKLEILSLFNTSVNKIDFLINEKYKTLIILEIKGNKEKDDHKNNKDNII